MPIQPTGDRMSAGTGTALVTRLGDQALAGPLGSLDAYLERVSRIAVLSREEERALAERFRSAGDLAAARQLVLSHLRFVVHIARGYSGYGLPIGDLIQEGNVGLMKAVKRFDPTLNVRLVSFAVHWIRAEIHEYVLRNWRLVKIATTKAQRKLFFNLRRATCRSIRRHGGGFLRRQPGEVLFQAAQVEEQLALRLGGGDLDQPPVTQYVLVNLGANPVDRERHQPYVEGGIEALDRLHEADVALLDEVTDRQSVAAVAARNVHHEPQVRQHQLPRGGEVAG